VRLLSRTMTPAEVYDGAMIKAMVLITEEHALLG
jgi:hypothetical protein